MKEKLWSLEILFNLIAYQMIKFFRHIRRSLIQENKMGKYFKYAIGEIILVVLGILIALGINNWNEHRKDLEKEKNISDNLQVEFKKNLKLIETNLQEINNNEQACLMLMKSMKQDIDKANTKTIDSLIYWALEHNTFNPSNSTYTEILNTGKIELIQNKQLKSSLFDWSRELEVNKSTHYIFEKWVEEAILPYLSKKIAIKNIDMHGALLWDKASDFESGAADILNDREFENLIDNNLYHISKIKSEYQKLKTIIDMILSETKSND